MTTGIDPKKFITPEEWNAMKLDLKWLSGPSGWLLFVACNSGVELAKRVKSEYENLLVENHSQLKEIPFFYENEDGELMTKVFEDTETRPRLPDHVAGSNVFIFQALDHLIDGASVNENTMQLYQMIRTLKVHGAKTITAVTPYSAYARQDKPSFLEREATLARLHADLTIASGVDQVVVYHPHTESIRGYYEPHARFVPLNGMDLFIKIFNKFKGLENVATVSTDAGGAKFTMYHASAMEISHAITNKFRRKEEEAELLGVIGDLEGKKIAIITDDESVTFGSVLGACQGLYEKGITEIYAAISHNKIIPLGLERLHEAHTKYGLKEFHTTNSYPFPDEVAQLDFVHVHSLEKRFARTINRLHYNQSVSGLFYRPNNTKKNKI